VSDACCDHDHGHGGEPTEAPQRLRDVREIQLSTAAGLALAAGLAASAADLDVG
jgi:hypothetical protein